MERDLTGSRSKTQDGIKEKTKRTPDITGTPKKSEQPTKSKTIVHHKSPPEDASRIETVDRGVGPTPHPPSLSEQRVPPYFGLGVPGYTTDPRNGLIDPHLASAAAAAAAAAYPFPYPPAPFPVNVNQPLPVNAQTNEGRYLWPPPLAFHQPGHGVTGSPAYSEISQLQLRSPLTGEPLSSFATRIQWEQYQRTAMHYSPLSHRGFSPGTFGGYPYPTYLPHPPSHVPSVSASQRSMFSEHPATPGSGSVTLPGSVDSSRLTSPRPSVIGKSSRKRALSHSPFSEYGLDIEILTRSSEGSLQLTPFAHNNSRSSSAASGSYGHLSAASLAAANSQAPGNFQHSLFRHPALPPTSPFYPPMMHHPMFMPPHAQGPMLPPSQPPLGNGGHGGSKSETQLSSTTAKEASSSVVSSTVDSRHNHHADGKKKRQEDGNSSGISKTATDPAKINHRDIKHDIEAQNAALEGEIDFIETHCHWRGCDKEFETQEELVRHINQDHIAANKKLFVCRWTDCSREEKPFKAQYMLVVHMRRHTGEKPHRCTFEGCAKAYSRLENLKTHLRSHTGEKPYMCEFPGCSKAFSNASDRAKHQNRTHSNAKPYVCKAPGCTKRYTDPSSLRKHVKTVHGPDFYANKKHKGDNLPGGGDGNDNGGGVASNGTGDVKEGSNHGHKGDSCPAANQLTGSSPEVKKENLGSTGSSNPTSPRSHSDGSPPDLTATREPRGKGMEEHVRGGRSVSSSIGGGSIGAGSLGAGSLGGGSLGTEEELSDADEIVLPATTVGTTTTAIRATRRMEPNRLKGRVQAKAPVQSLPTLPPIGNTRRVGQSNVQGTTEISQRPSQKRLNDLISLSAKETLGITSYHGNRRDSNASTLSSYMSSVRSEASPYPLNSRRSSDASQISRLSITNSPYEYDITGNLPNHPRQSSESGSIGNVTAQFEKTNLGSSTNLHAQSHSLRNPHSRLSHGSASGITPNHTPLPHDLPNRDVRRASDPIRCMDQNLSQLKELQRFHSLNSMKASPMPASLKARADSNQFMSSRSSIATDYSNHGDEMRLRDSGMDDQCLEPRLVEETDDLLIPDDMRDFLNEQLRSTQEPTADSTDCTGTDHQVMPSPCAQQPSPGSRCPLPSPCSQPSPGTRCPQPSPVGPHPSPYAHSQASPYTQSQASPFAQSQASPGCPQPSPCAQPQPSPGGLAPSGTLSGQPSPGAPVGQMGVDSGARQQWPADVKAGISNGASCQRAGYGNLTQQQQQQPTQPQQMLPNMGYMPMSQAMAQTHMIMPGMPQSNFANGYPGMGPYPNNNFNRPHPHPMSQQQQRQQQQQQQYPFNMQWPADHMNQPMGYNNQAFIHQMAPGASEMGGAPKTERNSPMVQVPHVSQSQIPARGKVSLRAHRQQQAQQMQRNHYMNGPMANVPAQNMQMNGQFNGQGNQGLQGQIQGQSQGQGQNQFPHNARVPFPNANMAANPNMNGYIGQGPGFYHHNVNSAMPVNQMNPGASNFTPNGHLNPQMSPGCNQVSSTSDPDCKNNNNNPPRHPPPPPNEIPPEFEDITAGPNLNSVSTDNLFDNLSSISMENINGGPLLTPTGILGGIQSQNSSRLTTPYMEGKSTAHSTGSYLENTSNMVVNDMSSVLSHLAEENKYLGMR